MKSRTFRALNAAFLLVGVGLLVWLIVRLDVSEVGVRLAEAGWMLLPAFVSYVGSLIFSTLAWQAVLDPEARRTTFGDLFAAFWAGHAINQVAPGGALGEVLKGSLVGKKVDGEELVASIVVSAFLTLAVGLVFTAGGPFVCLVALELPREVLVPLFAMAAVICAAVFGARALLRRGLAGRLVRLAERLPLVRPRNAEQSARKAAEVDRRIREFRARRPAAFLRAVLYLVLVRGFQVLEVWFLLLALLPDASPAWLLLLSWLSRATSQLISWLTAFVPGRIGVVEGGSAALFKLLGLDPVTGLSMELLRRVRKMLGVAVGLAIGWYVQARSAARISGG